MSNAIYKSKLIDSRNEDLFQTVDSQFNISFEPSNNREHSVYTIGNRMTFYIPAGEFCIDSFTHELLHGYIDACGVNLTGSLRNSVSGSISLVKLFDTELAEHIANCIAHTLMLPIFLNRGFDRSKFLFDYNYYKAESGIGEKIKRHFKIAPTVYNILAVRTFIGKYFAFKCDPNPAFDYSVQIRELQQIDQALYNILENYISKWANYDFSDDEYSEFRLNHLDFADEMEIWMSDKSFA
ncbi:hypothetical protein [Pedobacter roseus]|uniref:Uncharacterized protein n=1 Tax=Pedobacter roseus TaxID=336820 RepID=A0A7G9QMB6_9SPHI|nr:hypothetical protein [Pedobacter roseus]QNN44491.1 hypothetical protein H9L23_10630 [Pedobacter roseus]